MDNLVIETNKNYAEKNFKEILKPFCDDLIKKNNEIKELKTKLFLIEKERVSLARAYAKELGVLINKISKKVVKNKIIKNKVIERDLIKGILDIEGSEEFVSEKIDTFLEMQESAVLTGKSDEVKE